MTIQNILDSINLKNPDKDLFSDTAEKINNILNDKKLNTDTQIRQFYDELCFWHQKINTNDEFNKYVPYINMLTAKAKYAEGRKLVTEEFVNFIRGCLKMVEDKESLYHFKLLFESILGFKKANK